ncbi:MAG TPA: Tn3 family transposase, partial [Streptosporangiaceae bacterium]|nr:Tn3 family transposase [Streptosporangiaceae bacterium]
ASQREPRHEPGREAGHEPIHEPRQEPGREPGREPGHEYGAEPGRELISQQYDPMIKYATAIRLGTASTEAILRRFTRDVTHPAYAAMPEPGRAQRIIFLVQWLRDGDLQRETTEDVPAFVELESGGPPPGACRVVGVGQPPSHPTKERGPP